MAAIESISFNAGGRKRNLSRLKQGGPFYVRFTHDGKNYVRSLGTRIESTAVSNAKKIINDIVEGAGKLAEQMKVRNDYSTLRDVCEVYQQNYGQDARTAKTARNNIGALKRLVKVGLGRDIENGRGDILAGLDKVRTDVLTGELVRKFEKAEEKRIERDAKGWMKQASEVSVRTSIGSILKQARAIFKRQTMHWFEGLTIPDLTTFRDQGVKPAQRGKPQPLDEAVIAAINEAAPALAESSPACYIAHLLFSRMGMRNGEIEAARRSWIITDKKTGRKKIGIVYRPEEGFKPKAKTERWLPVAACVLEAIEKHWKQSDDGDFLVPARNKTERAEIVDREHATWCGQWIKDRSKVSYELRRHAGSLIFTKSGNLAHVQAFLGHSDLATTQRWYWYLLDELPELDMMDFAA